ncbi:MAG: hypothetical protein ABSC05_09000 [Candidatus Solibacter sp.]|jgi:hypothetical protein
MKARWTPKDMDFMTRKPLRFEPEDVKWIHLGLDTRAARDISPAADE